MRWHRSYDVAIGLSLLGGSSVRLFRAERGPLAVHLALAGLSLLVGGLFLCRMRAVQTGGRAEIVLALPALILGTVAARLPGGTWPVLAQAGFVLGALVAGVSLGVLGRSFAVLPARRALVRHGPYRWVRHPGYLGEQLMLVSAACVEPWPTMPVALGALVTVRWRIEAEERTLGLEPGWEGYRREVPWRLVPGLY